MTGQEILLTALKYPKDSKTREYYIQLSDLYNEEFGVGWTLKEIADARTHILNLATPGGGMKTVLKTVCRIVESQDKPFVGNSFHWVGTKNVGHADYCIYCKGLYWMAGYDILNEL